jgi:hypothetical protein
VGQVNVVSMLPSPNMVTVLVTPDDFVVPEITQVVEKKWWAIQDLNL